MKRVISGTISCCALALLMALPAQAQVAWDAPQMLSPQMPGGFGIYLVDPAVPGPGNDGLGVMATWRAREIPGVGFRVGVAEGDRETFSGFGGVDISGRMVQATEEFPLHVIWITGAGIGFGDYLMFSFPVGVSLGRAFETDGVWFNPYVSPRLVLDAQMGDNRREDDLDMRLAIDLGTDIAFSESWAVRFGASVGDRSALAIGLAFPTSSLSR